MNQLYEKAKDVTIIRRTPDNKEFEEYPLLLRPLSALVTDPTNDIVCVSLCALSVGSAISALSASYANSASYAITSSYAFTASLALVSSVASSALNAVSSSYSLYADSASYGTNFYAPRVTASYVSASTGMFTYLTASNLVVTGLSIGTSSYAIRSSTCALADTMIGIEAGLASQDTTFGTGSVVPHSVISFGTLVSNETHPHASAKGPDGKLYCAGWDGNIWRIDDPDGAFATIVTASIGPIFSDADFNSVTGKLYLITATALYEVEPSTLNASVKFSFPSGTPGLLPPLRCADKYAYTVFTSGGSSSFFKIDVTTPTGSLVQTAPWLSASVNPKGNPHANVMTPDKSRWLVTTSHGAIANVDTSNIASYTIGQELNPSGLDASITDDCTYLNGYLYTVAETDTYLWKMNINTMSSSLHFQSLNSFAISTEGVHIYVGANSGEIWIYPYGDITGGPIRFSIGGGLSPNELFFTNAGYLVWTQWLSTNIYRTILPLATVGINTVPSYTLDVQGTINCDFGVQCATISASSGGSYIAGHTTTDNIVLQEPAVISHNTTRLKISGSLVQATRISGSAALFGRANNIQFSRSFGFGIPLAVTQSLGTVSQDGMYRLSMASTIGFYSSSTVTNPPSWSFKHTDRLATYNLPFVQTVNQIAASPYNTGFVLSGEFIFQAVAGTAIEYYWFGPDLSSTHCSASFFTTTALTQILSGSVTGSV